MATYDTVRFRDLAVPQPERRELLEILDAAMQRGQFILGDEVEEFEREFAQACSRSHCVGVSNGTGALYLALRALGIGKRDEVITSPMSWVATGNAVLALGARPVFADVRDDFNLDPAAAGSAITRRTKAILPVHFYGRIADMSAFMALGASSTIPVVEDAAQAFGATLDGRPAGSFGDMAAFSLNPMKPLAALGEAGAVVTDRGYFAERIASLRYLGTVDRETCVDPSLNFKIDTLQAVILRHRMKRVPKVVARRNKIADAYSQALRDVVLVPESPKNGASTYFDYTIVCDERDELERVLIEQGIEVKVKHRLLLTQQPGYKHIDSGHLPNAERLVKGILSLPIHEALTEPQIDRVVTAIRRFYGG